MEQDSSAPPQTSVERLIQQVQKEFTGELGNRQGPFLTAQPVPQAQVARHLGAAQVQHTEGIPLVPLLLIFAGMLLRNGRVHLVYYIRKACTLHLVLRLCGGMQFILKSSTDKTVRLGVAVSATVRRHKTITLDVDVFDTIAVVKAMTRGQEGISSYQLRWFFAGVQHKDDRMHSGYYIQKAHLLHVLRLRGSMQFILKSLMDKTITMGEAVSYIAERRHKTIILDVDAFDTVVGVKALFPAHNIRKQSALRCSRGGLRIIVKTLMGRSFTLDVEASVTVDSVKAQFHDKACNPSDLQVYDKEGRPRTRITAIPMCCSSRPP